MGYATSIQAFQKAKKYLDALKAAKDPITWASADPRKLQYIIHNGLFVAELLKIPEYQKLKATWRVKQAGRYVIATPFLSADQTGSAIVYIDLSDPFSIVDKLSQLKGSANDSNVIFENCNITPDDLHLVINWCESNGRIAEHKDGNLYVKPKVRE